MTITPENQAYMDRVRAERAAKDAADATLIIDSYEMASPDDLRSFAKGERDAAQRLIDKYGQGVRPSWISTDIAINYDKARLFDLAATQKEVRA